MSGSYKAIDPEVSRKYGIVNFGKNGMEIIRDGVSIAKFKDKSTQLENWLDAVEFCEAPGMYYTILDPASGTGNFLNTIIKNPPFGK
jgi:hypothetical protein